MADLSDVSNALGLLCQEALYPEQATPAGNSVAGMPVLIQVGWPVPASLDAMVKARKAQVTVYPRPIERNVTRYPRTWYQGAMKAKTFTLTQLGQAITVGGAAPAIYYRQNVCVFANGKPYIFSTVDGSTVATIAAGLAALIVADIPGTAAVGAVLTIPSPARIGALRVGTGAPVVQEVKRQQRQYQIVVWAASPEHRDAIGRLIDVAVGLADWLTLADATAARVIYQGSPFTEGDQKQGIYRRDFILSVEYATTNLDFAPELVAARTDIEQLTEDGSETHISTNYN